MDYFRFQQALRLIGEKAAARAQSKTPSSNTVGIREPETAAQWHAAALDHMQRNDRTAAITSWEQALRCEIRELELLDRMGQGLRDAGFDPIEVASRAWRKMESEPAPKPHAPPCPGWHAALLAVLGQHWSEALPVMESLFREREASLHRARNYAFLLQHLGRSGEAECVLAVNLLARNQVSDAVEAFFAAPRDDAQSPVFLGRLLYALRRAGEGHRAIDIANNAAERGIHSSSATFQWACALLDLNRHDEAIDILKRRGEAFGDWRLRLEAGLVLPAVPATQEDMDRAHHRAHQAIHALHDVALPTDASELAALEGALGPNFYLAYRGEPDVPEIRGFGNFVSRVMATRYPQHAGPCSSRRRGPGERIRVGYAASSACQSAPMRFLAGWLEHADHATFEWHLFPLDSQQDWMAGYLGSMMDCVHEATRDAESAARTIRDAQLDVLVYPEIGLHNLCMRLAALRLAPVQCVANGHSVSTGLPTLDYFISNDAMEPEDAASHYTERLVTLPGIGLCLPPSPVPTTCKPRGDLGLPSDAVVYFCAQSFFKYLPRLDDVFARIASEVGNAVFVFREDIELPDRTRTFHERMRASFRAHGLDPDRHVRIFPVFPTFDDFLGLYMVSDVFLDPIGWSGALTVLDALSCGLPPVLLPGKLMRGRQSYGFMKQIGIEDTIATDLDDYISIAARLGQDRAWRDDVASRIRERRHLLFNDTRCVKSLEAFYRWAVGAAQPGDAAMFKVWPRAEEPALS